MAQLYVGIGIAAIYTLPAYAIHEGGYGKADVKKTRMGTLLVDDNEQCLKVTIVKCIWYVHIKTIAFLHFNCIHDFFSVPL